MNQDTPLSIFRLLSVPSSTKEPPLAVSCSSNQPVHELIPLVQSSDDEVKATLGLEVCNALTLGFVRASRERPRLRAFSVDSGRRLVLYSLPADATFTVSSIVGDPHNHEDLGMPVEKFLLKVDATVMMVNEAEGDGIRSSFIVSIVFAQ